AQDNVDGLNPLLVANSSAERPLARHSRIRSTHFASVSFVMHSQLAATSTLAEERRSVQRLRQMQAQITLWTAQGVERAFESKC
ncbi:MAG TPA: hypothetical protein VEK07_02935, partial [Polyangiaceae bacterium]|nr:hypothetical protein [Polyangiaceae bacterium]